MEESRGNDALQQALQKAASSLRAREGIGTLSEKTLHAAIKFYMEQNGLSPEDLEPALGNLNSVKEVLNSTRPLTLDMIRKLHSLYGIPAESLIKEPIAKVAI